MINTPSASSMNKIMIDWKGNVMSGSMYKPLQGLILACFLLVGIQITDISQMNAWAGPSPSPKSTMPAGDAERSSTGRVSATTAMALMGTRANDRNSQLTQPRSLLNLIRHRSIWKIRWRYT
ncbi:MAG: hypothetical protein JW395_0265 [Nitrospira sp.]|nr:hypothetical protein [Nitrospira sp.]